jgi:hypothetical protein
MAGQQMPLSDGSFEVFNGLAPRKSPRTLPLSLDFSVINPIARDLTLAQDSDKIEWVQALYADNSLNPFPFSVTFAVTGQVLTWPPFTQGYLPCLCPNNPRFVASTTGTPVINVQMLTFPMPATMWEIVNASSFRLISANNTNATVIKASPGKLLSWNISNTGAAAAFVKFYDKATLPSVGADVPKLTLTIPGATTGGLNISSQFQPINFTNGVAIAITNLVTQRQ